jgi:hypothetical protein
MSAVHSAQYAHHAALIRCAPTLPTVWAVAEYDQWLAETLGHVADGAVRSKCRVTGAQLRRAVIMRQGGQTLRDIGKAIGVSESTAKHWLDRLPPTLTAPPGYR